MKNKNIPLYSLDKESFQKKEEDEEEEAYSENFEKESNLD